MKIIENYNNLCFKCLKHTNVESYAIPELGKGSFFDGFTSEVHLCSACITDGIKKWLELEVIGNDKNKRYLFEGEILSLIAGFPLEGRELFFNRFAYGPSVPYRSTLAWLKEETKRSIDTQATEQQAEYADIGYYNRFEKCKEVINVKMPDESVISRCPFGEIGKEDAKPFSENCEDKCSQCMQFTPRTMQLRTIPYANMNEYFQMKLKELMIQMNRNQKNEDYMMKHIHSTQINESKVKYKISDNELCVLDTDSKITKDSSCKIVITDNEVGGLENE